MKKSSRIQVLFGRSAEQGGSAQRSRLSFRRSRGQAEEAAHPPQESNEVISQYTNVATSNVNVGIPSADTSVASAPGNVETTPQSTTNKRLWDQAYDKLKTQNGELIDAYETILAKAAGDEGAGSLSDKAMLVISKKLQIMRTRQWKLRIPWVHGPVLIRDLVDKLVRVAQKLEVAGSAVGNVDPVHVGLPFAGICILVQLITNDSHQHQTVIKGLDEITDLLSIYADVEHEYLCKSESLVKKNFSRKLEDLYLHVLEFLAKAVRYFDLNTAQRLARNIPKLDDWDALILKIRKSNEVCQMLANASAVEDQRNRTKTLLHILGQQRSSIQDLANSLKRESDKNSTIISWVSAIEVQSDHSIVRQKLGSHYADSGQWLRPQYESWKANAAKPTFWICGSAGTGKSSLTSSVIEWYIKSIESSDTERLAFFYCSRKRAERNTPLDVLASLVAQLSWSIDGLSVAESVKALYLSDQKRKLTLKECSELLVSLILPYQKATIVIDALDECLDSTQLLRHLRTISKGTDDRIKFFFSSRKNTSIFAGFPSWIKLELDLQQQATAPDMERYIRCQVRDIEALDMGSRLLDGKYPDIENRLVGTLTNRAQGMFRWAELQLSAFLGPNASIHHPKDAINKLEKLEKETGMPELDAVYEEIYQMNTAADSESRNIAMRAYRWILAAQRQLLIAELTEAVSYDERGVSDLALTPELLLKLCSNFIFADLLQAVQFSHLSAREFLEKRCTHSVLDYSAVQNHKQAAISCLSFLTHNDIQGVKSLEVGTGFLGYAFGFWMVHSQLAQDFREEPPLKKLFQNMISNTPSNGKEPFLGWMNALEECQSALRMDGSFQHPNKLLASQSYPPNPLFLGCVWGFREVFDMVSCSIDLKQLNAQKKTGLYVACEYGNYDVALILLEKGADVNAITGAHGSALQAAASGGYEQIVELLLDRGAFLNFRDYNDTSALGAAAKGGYESIFRRLFEMGADQGDYGSALRNAAAEGSRDLIKLLLDAGADVECLGGYGGRPLVEAAYTGRKEAVEILLEYGADVNGAGRPWGTPLQACSVMGHTNIAELLLLHGARPNDVGGEYGSALHAAAKRGHLDLMTVLLRNGADINLQGILADGYAVGTPLRVAAERGAEQSVMFLLQNGADINKPGGADLHISTPLQTSIFTGRHPRLFKLLLEKGALAYPKAGEFNEELCLASASGNLEIVRVLIDKGADVNFIGGRWGTPLQASAIGRPDKEREEIAKLLIQEGAKVNLTDPARPRLSSALESAAASGNLSLVKLLLKEGACLAQGQSNFGCALTAAAADGYKSVVQFLLDTNADIDFSSKRYGSALQAAAENSNLKVVKLLYRANPHLTLQVRQPTTHVTPRRLLTLASPQPHPSSPAFLCTLHRLTSAHPSCLGCPHPRSRSCRERQLLARRIQGSQNGLQGP